jgi:hypothetical protein
VDTPIWPAGVLDGNATAFPFIETDSVVPADTRMAMDGRIPDGVDRGARGGRDVRDDPAVRHCGKERRSERLRRSGVRFRS